MIQRYSILLYAVGAYILAMANIVYIVGFLADYLVPKSINDGVQGDLWTAVFVDLGLIWLFGFQHSSTARTWFKKHWTKIISPAIERATYLYMTAGMTWLLVHFWRPIPITLWQLENVVLIVIVYGLYFLVLNAMFAATFHFGHFGFFGLRDAWNHFLERDANEEGFCARWLYSLVRHPISLGWMLIPWITPHMTVGQLVFALGMTSYVLLATPFEEADLIRALGDKYRGYRQTVPAFIPFSKKRKERKESDPAFPAE